jgi:selenium metabolism protein YedF
MSESTKVIDARGLACPEPVIRTKKALEEGGASRLEVLVDNEAARENVLRFAGFSGCAATVSGEGSGSYRVTVETAGYKPADPSLAEAAACESQPQPSAQGAAAATVFIPASEIGRGESELGALLMKGFIFALAESDAPPKRIIFMNSGVRLAVKGSESLANLLRLESRGVEILACGTCLDYYKVKDSLAVGRVSNMYEIAGFLLEGRTLSV